MYINNYTGKFKVFGKLCNAQTLNNESTIPQCICKYNTSKTCDKKTHRLKHDIT